LLSVSEYYGVANRSEKVSDGEFVSRAETLVGYKKCFVGDLVSNIMLAWKGSMGITECDGIVSPAYCVYEPSKSVFPRYYHYLFRTSLYTSIFRLYSKGIIDSRLRLYSPYFFDIKAIIPSYSEQQRIAEFLDRKCAEVDEMIALQEQIIEELKAYKQSVITEAVTKGLNPDAPMCDSGIDWIGQTPEHWEVKRLKQVLSSPLQYGANESGMPYQENLPRYVRITDILDNSLRDNIEKQSLTEQQADGYILQHNDILFARSGGTVGKSFIFNEKYGRCAFAGYLIKASVNELMDAKFIYYFTQTNCYEEWKKQIFIQSTIQNIGADRYSQLQLTIPSTSEQQAIADYLDEKCADIDSLIQTKQSKIDSLKEYKKSIIYEYVTGKREVE
jgi:type I restriction enzyme S subunit